VQPKNSGQSKDRINKERANIFLLRTGSLCSLMPRFFSMKNFLETVFRYLCFKIRVFRSVKFRMLRKCLATSGGRKQGCRLRQGVYMLLCQVCDLSRLHSEEVT
jgi:hypothetical protein